MSAWKPGHQSQSYKEATARLATVPMFVLRNKLMKELAIHKACRGQTFKLGQDVAGNSPDLFSYAARTAIYIIPINEALNERQYREESTARLIAKNTNVINVHAKEILLGAARTAKRVRFLILPTLRKSPATV